MDNEEIMTELKKINVEIRLLRRLLEDRKGQDGERNPSFSHECFSRNYHDEKERIDTGSKLRVIPGALSKDRECLRNER